jgi:hypothetical protein
MAPIGNGPVSWQVVDAQLDRDDEGPVLSLTAERDFAEVEDIPDHDLEHELAENADDSLPEEAEALIARAARENLELELVVLDPGEEPSWDDAARFLEALILDEIEDDLLESSGRIATRASSHRSARSRTRPTRTAGTAGCAGSSMRASSAPRGSCASRR